jgi:hypothetical protein
VAERLNAAALKAVFGVFLGRGFESLPLRHVFVDRNRAGEALIGAPSPVLRGGACFEGGGGVLDLLDQIISQ